MPPGKKNAPSETMLAGVADAAMPGLSSASALQLWDANRPHIQHSPGAYEWWRVEAINAQGDGVLLLLFNGLPFHPDYLIRVARSLRRNPAKTPARMQAANYPAAYFAIYKNHQRQGQFLNMYPPGTFSAAADGLEIRVGPNRLTMRPDGSIGVDAKGYPFTFSTRAGRIFHHTSQELAASLTLVPTFPGVQQIRPFRPPAKDGAAHLWVIAAPHCRATGSARLINHKTSETLIEQPISCPGYHDHMLGQSVLGKDLKRIVWAYANGENFALVWQGTILSDGTQAPTNGLMFFEKDREPIIIESPQIVIGKFRRTRPWLLRYPTQVLIHGSDSHGNPAEVVVEHSLIDASPFHWRLRSTVTINLPKRGRYTAAGVATGVMMGRLKWPLLSDAVLDAIHPIPSDDPLWRQ